MLRDGREEEGKTENDEPHPRDSAKEDAQFSKKKTPDQSTKKESVRERQSERERESENKMYQFS